MSDALKDVPPPHRPPEPEQQPGASANEIASQSPGGAEWQQMQANHEKALADREAHAAELERQEQLKLHDRYNLVLPEWELQQAKVEDRAPRAELVGNYRSNGAKVGGAAGIVVGAYWGRNEEIEKLLLKSAGCGAGGALAGYLFGGVLGDLLVPAAQAANPEMPPAVYKRLLAGQELPRWQTDSWRASWRELSAEHNAVHKKDWSPGLELIQAVSLAKRGKL